MAFVSLETIGILLDLYQIMHLTNFPRFLLCHAIQLMISVWRGEYNVYGRDDSYLHRSAEQFCLQQSSAGAAGQGNLVYSHYCSYHCM
jgi:hypothetical protein